MISFKAAPKLELVDVGNEDIGVLEVVKRGCITPAEEEKILPLIRLYKEATDNIDRAKQDKSVPPSVEEKYNQDLGKVRNSLAAELLRRTHPDWDEEFNRERAAMDAKTVAEHLPKPLVYELSNFLLDERRQWEPIVPDWDDDEAGKPSTGTTTSEASPTSAASPSTDSSTTSPQTLDGEAGKASAKSGGSKSKPASEKPSE